MNRVPARSGTLSAANQGSGIPDPLSVPVGAPLIALEDVYKIYRVADTGVAALGGVSFELDRGEMVALLGPSGSGKSSILNIVGGLDRPSAGVASVAGRDLGRLSDAELTRYRRASVGFVWQGTARNLVPYLSLARNVEVPLLIAGRRRRERRKRIRDLLELIGMADRAGHMPAMLSGGEQQRAGLAVALANHPAILLADEPTAELDSAAAARTMDAFREASRALGTTVIVVTHDPASAAVADRTLRLLDGRIRHPASPGRVEEDRRVRLPADAIAALGAGEVDVEVAGSDVTLRRTAERERPDA
jgi:putative ABC transport system ATP-binding protein